MYTKCVIRFRGEKDVQSMKHALSKIFSQNTNQQQ